MIEELDDEAFASRGHRTAFLSRLTDIEELIAEGQTEEAIEELENLRRRVDGCGETPDRDDWIVDCDAQRDVRRLIDRLIDGLQD